MGHLILGNLPNWEPRTFNNLEVCVHGECDDECETQITPLALCQVC